VTFGYDLETRGTVKIVIEMTTFEKVNHHKAEV